MIDIEKLQELYKDSVRSLKTSPKKIKLTNEIIQEMLDKYFDSEKKWKVQEILEWLESSRNIKISVSTFYRYRDLVKPDLKKEKKKEK